MHNKIKLPVLLIFAVLIFAFTPYSSDPLFNLSSVPQKVYDKLRLEHGQAELPDWALLSPEKDGYEGTNTLELYNYISSQNPVPLPKEIIVAVMDSGFDIDHPDLKDKVWKNTAEVNGTPGVDDDGNGFVDDFNGWNFLGKDTSLNLEVTREYARLQKENVDDAYFKKVKKEYDEKKAEDEQTYSYVKKVIADTKEAMATLKEGGYTTDPVKLKDLTLEGKYKDASAKIMFVYNMTGMQPEQILELEPEFYEKAVLSYDLNFNPSTGIGDNPEIMNEKNYGNNDVTIKRSSHGTHVAGIIASSKSSVGQAPFVKLMLLRVVPAGGDERDKDVANGIRYAADNGASIINLSAGKYFSPNTQYLIESIKYAEEKGVLFVVASGNDASDISVKVNYPPKFYMENGQMKYFPNLICVGASTWAQKESKEKDPDNLLKGYGLCASFSNYSAKVVDVFAPGFMINSTIPGGKYTKMSGTSMASPECAGVAAIIKGYFPDLTPSELKDVIINSARVYKNLPVKYGDELSGDFSTLSKTGGVIDAFAAYKYAAGK